MSFINPRDYLPNSFPHTYSLYRNPLADTSQRIPSRGNPLRSKILTSANQAGLVGIYVASKSNTRSFLPLLLMSFYFSAKKKDIIYQWRIKTEKATTLYALKTKNETFYALKKHFLARYKKRFHCLTLQKKIIGEKTLLIFFFFWAVVNFMIWFTVCIVNSI